MGGSAIPIPQIGENFEDGLYVARCRLGYGNTDGSAGGASDGLDVWSDTQEVVTLFEINSSGVLIHQAQHFIPTAFTAAVDLSFGPSTDPDGFAEVANVAATVQRFEMAGLAATEPASFNGFLFNSTGSITATFATADPAVGIAEFYIVYSYAPQRAQNDTGGSVNT